MSTGPRSGRLFGIVVACVTWCALLGGCTSAASPARGRSAASLPENRPSQPKASQSEGPRAQKAKRGKNVSSGRIPSTCDSHQPGCVPPLRFTQQLCRRRFGNLALYLFSSSSPWERIYVNAPGVEPLNAYGGERSRERLQLGEEVLLLRRHGSSQATGMQVSGPADVDILRWDGTCATIPTELLTEAKPWRVLAARILWKYLDGAIQQALLRDPRVAEALERQDAACHGSSLRSPNKTCDQAILRVTEAVTTALRGGLELPEPHRVPLWTSTQR